MNLKPALKRSRRDGNVLRTAPLLVPGLSEQRSESGMPIAVRWDTVARAGILSHDR